MHPSGSQVRKLISTDKHCTPRGLEVTVLQKFSVYQPSHKKKKTKQKQNTTTTIYVFDQV